MSNVEAYEIEMIKIASFNKRRHKPDPRADESLAESIKNLGQLQPGIARCIKNGKEVHYELLAGARRLKAIKAAGLDAMRLDVITCSDDEARAICIVENMQRSDVHPIDQAEAIVELLKCPGMTFETVGAKLGMTRGEVARRAQLAKLTKAWKKEIDEPDSMAAMLSVEHYEEVARLSPTAQDEILEQIKQFSQYGGDTLDSLTIQSLRKMIQSGLGNLSNVPWALDDDGLVPKAGACTNCPKRAHAELDLFDDLQPGAGACRDADCFDNKMHAQLQITAKKVEDDHGKKPMLIAAVPYQNVLTESGEGVAHASDFMTVKKDTPGAIPAMSVDADKPGKITWVKPKRPAAEMSTESKKAVKAEQNGKPKSLKERRETLNARRDKWVIEKARVWLDDNVCHSKDVVKLLNQEKFPALCLLAVFGLPYRQDTPDEGDWKELKALMKATAGDVPDKLVQGLAQVFASRLSKCYDLSHVPRCMSDLTDIANVFLDLPLNEFQNQSQDEIPEPKGWAKLAPAEGEKKTVTKRRAKAARRPKPRPSSKRSPKASVRRLKRSAARATRTRRKGRGKG